ncbi:hypothetical protein B0H13DRAFT_2372637 [Mycena leptocephala]|nr:hypothetical protein B0H13DRAFT_2372637 [Mycena leptocephala]
MSAIRTLKEMHTDNPGLIAANVLALDVPGTHYAATRDGTIEEFDGTFDRFSLKDVYLNRSLHFGSLYGRKERRMTGDLYRPHIIGQVNHRTIMYNDNPLGNEGKGREGICVYIKCPTDASPAIVEFYKLQFYRFVFGLNLPASKGGSVGLDWVSDDGLTSSGLPMIKILLSRRASMHAYLEDERDVDITVNVTIDQGRRDKETHFKLWYSACIPLSHADVGRV